ncbi:accessory Sec system protein Asp3 [Microbacterium tumbae]
MANSRIATVRWGGINSRASLYGTALAREASGDVHLVNRLMPSGTTMQEWYSFTDYQAVRDAPSLPLLHAGRTYRLEPELTPTPDDSVIFEVRFFDRFDALIRAEVLHPPAYAFEYPAGCHHYTIRLVNGGCDELRFTAFTLREGEG